MKKLYIIGIGYKPFNKRERDILYNASLILTSSRLSEVFKGYDEFESVKDNVKVINNVDETIDLIKSQIANLRSHIVLLASGDPMFFGIGRRAIREFGKDIVEIYPDLSSIQLAFSRIKEAWDDAFLMSVHGGPDPEKRRRLPYEIKDIPLLLQIHNKIAILTDRENNPAEIAKVINSSMMPDSRDIFIYVCEKLGYPDERIISDSLNEISRMRFRDPNVVILIKKDLREKKYSSCLKAQSDTLFGLSEEEIHHSRGLITKDEVRAITIHKLRLPNSGVFWDIGSGSGSISIEIARLFPYLNVFAIEKDDEQIENISINRTKFNRNIKIIKGEAPHILKDLPSPDRVFIGGSGGMLLQILESVSIRMGHGIIVINASQMSTVSLTLNKLRELGFNVEMCQINVSRMKPLGNDQFLSALNPVFIIKGEKCS